MMRSTAVRRVTSYEFGQPHLGTGFGTVIMHTRNPALIVDHGVKRTTLPNGATLITHDKSGAATAIGFYADAGVKYDTYKTLGATCLLKWSLYGGNLNSSAFQIDRSLRSVGSSFASVEVNKKLVGAVTYNQRSAWRTAVEQLSATFAAPRFANSDIEKWRDHADSERNEMRWTQPRTYAINELEGVAYYREPLGNPRLIDPILNDKVTSDVLLDKYVTYFNPNRVTIVGVNVAHEELISEYTNSAFPHSAEAPHHQRAAAPQLTAGKESAQYYGGRDAFEYENRPNSMGTKPNYTQETIAAVGWNTVGVESGLAEYAAALVYVQMLNIAANETLSNVANLPAAHGIQAFYRPYSTAGLIGFTSLTAPEHAKDVIKKMIKTLPTDFVAHLPAAKARAAVALAAESMEADTDYATFLAVSPYSAEELLAAIDAATVAQVAGIVDGIKSVKPSLFATGDTAKLPSLRHFL